MSNIKGEDFDGHLANTGINQHPTNSGGYGTTTTASATAAHLSYGPPPSEVRQPSNTHFASFPGQPPGADFASIPPAIPIQSTAAVVAAAAAAAAGEFGLSSPQKASAPTGKFKKAPDAPKRFKSAFIIYSAEKHREIKENLARQGRSEKTTDIAKLVSEAWREMPPEEKELWENKAKMDKARYEVEKSMYTGPWKIPANKRTPKDPQAPKRPMSAFLAFSNKRRAALKRQHPNATNADLSKMLSKTWREIDEEMKKRYMDEEAGLRATYKVNMAQWRKRVAEEKKAERKEREAVAMQTAEARQLDSAGGRPVGPPPMGMPGAMQSKPVPSSGMGGGGPTAPGQAMDGSNKQGHVGGTNMPPGGPGGMFPNPYGMQGGPGGGPMGDMSGAYGMQGGPGFGGFMHGAGYGGQAMYGPGSAAQQQIFNQIYMNQQMAQRSAMGGMFAGQSLQGPNLHGQGGIASGLGQGLGGQGIGQGLGSGTAANPNLVGFGMGDPGTQQRGGNELASALGDGNGGNDNGGQTGYNGSKGGDPLGSSFGHGSEHNE